MAFFMQDEIKVQQGSNVPKTVKIKNDVLVGSITQPPIPLDEYMEKYPCETRWWNSDVETC